MGRLLLLRHAKSSWDEPSLPDVERPLTGRGERAARAMADMMTAKGYLPDRILCSSALRTRLTLAPLLRCLTDETEILLTRRLYEPAGPDYLKAIAALGGEAETLMVIGHNPAVQATALALIGPAGADVAAAVAAKYPTAALVVLGFDSADWSRVAPHTGIAEAFLSPRDSD